MALRRYRTIVADPPWEYNEGFPSGVARPDGSLERWTYELPYESMHLDELRALPLQDYACLHRVHRRTVHGTPESDGGGVKLLPIFQCLYCLSRRHPSTLCPKRPKKEDHSYGWLG